MKVEGELSLYSTILVCNVTLKLAIIMYNQVAMHR